MNLFGIDSLAEGYNDFRRVIWTGDHSQLVVMTLQVGEDIGEEVHPAVDQLFRIVSGLADVKVNDEIRGVEEGDFLCVPAGSLHNVINTGPLPLVLYTIYSPPNHAANTVHHTKADAGADKDDIPPKAL